MNAAGGNDPKVTVTADHAFEKIPLEAWLANFDLNLVGGVLLPCQEFGPGMVKRGNTNRTIMLDRRRADPSTS